MNRPGRTGLALATIFIFSVALAFAQHHLHNQADNQTQRYLRPVLNICLAQLRTKFGYLPWLWEWCMQKREQQRR